ncbi:MAG: hypothetical protein MI742_04380 [Desulfobacterales bacterium]|nr:hypothetical protein [Desulfobacterales bacterium]
MDSKAASYLDSRLCFCLILLLKEYLHQKGMPDIWERSKEFSNQFPGWLYGEKLKGGFDRAELDRLLKSTLPHNR